MDLVSTAQPEAQAGLAANYGAFGLTLVRYAGFEKPTGIKVNGAEQNLPADFRRSETGRNDGAQRVLDSDLQRDGNSERCWRAASPRLQAS